MVFFGLFHGLVFLPVVLSLVGPLAYPHADVIAKSRQIAVRADVGLETASGGIPSADLRANGEVKHAEVGV